MFVTGVRAQTELLHTTYTWYGPWRVHAHSYDLLTREYATTPCNEEIKLEFLSLPRTSNGGLSIIPQWPCRPLLSDPFPKIFRKACLSCQRTAQRREGGLVFSGRQFCLAAHFPHESAANLSHELLIANLAPKKVGCRSTYTAATPWLLLR